MIKKTTLLFIAFFINTTQSNSTNLSDTECDLNRTDFFSQFLNPHEIEEISGLCPNSAPALQPPSYFSEISKPYAGKEATSSLRSIPISSTIPPLEQISRDHTMALNFKTLSKNPLDQHGLKINAVTRNTNFSIILPDAIIWSIQEKYYSENKGSTVMQYLDHVYEKKTIVLICMLTSKN
jgi:hypothetical protein